MIRIRTTPNATAARPGASVSMSPRIGRKSGITLSTRCAHSICMKWMKIAPKTSGQSEPSPPTTTPTSRKIESAIGNVSGLTNVVAIASSEPATPA